MKPTPIKIVFGQSWIELPFGFDASWTPSDDKMASLASLANVLSKPPYYEYSPAHGGFGPYVASLVAKKLGGELFLPETEEATEPPEGIVF